MNPIFCLEKGSMPAHAWVRFWKNRLQASQVCKCFLSTFTCFGHERAQPHFWFLLKFRYNFDISIWSIFLTNCWLLSSNEGEGFRRICISFGRLPAWHPCQIFVWLLTMRTGLSAQNPEFIFKRIADYFYTGNLVKYPALDRVSFQPTVSWFSLDIRPF